MDVDVPQHFDSINNTGPTGSDDNYYEFDPFDDAYKNNQLNLSPPDKYIPKPPNVEGEENTPPWTFNQSGNSTYNGWYWVTDESWYGDPDNGGYAFKSHPYYGPKRDLYIVTAVDDYSATNQEKTIQWRVRYSDCLLYTSPSPRD